MVVKNDIVSSKKMNKVIRYAKNGSEKHVCSHPGYTMVACPSLE